GGPRNATGIEARLRGVLAPVGPGDGERDDRSEAPPARDDAEAVGPREDEHGAHDPPAPARGQAQRARLAVAPLAAARQPAPERVLSTSARPREEGVRDGADGGRDALLARHRRTAQLPWIAGGGARGQERDQDGKRAGESHDRHTRARP